MATTWLINGSAPEALGVAIAGGAFQSGAASQVRLRAVRGYDAAGIAALGDAVTITRNGDPFFRGRVTHGPRLADGRTEAHEYLVEDAWADLERTTYQEPWATQTGTVLSPRVFLGVDSGGARITLGAQIEAALDFAIAAGIPLAKGTIPAGMLLWPSEAVGLSCAEVIRGALRYHPDWIPWLDHSTNPPTFRVTPRASATALTVAAAGTYDLAVSDVAERLPAGVRIVFETVSDVDGTVARVATEQKFPTDSPASGPGVLATCVELAGVRATTQKQQVQTRHLPATAGDITLSAQAWLKLKYPAIAGIADAKFTVAEWTRTIVTDGETKPGPINPNATRLAGTTFSELPRELVAGTIHEWMRRRVGRVRLEWKIEPAETATAEERELLGRIGTGTTVTATNATTKVYTGLASWTAAEDVPAGIAQAYYETIHAGARHEGSATLATADIVPPWHGRVINITGGPAAWATMAAPIHRVDWDMQAGTATFGFGPTPSYSVQDFLEYLRLLSRRPVSWISTEERASAEIGAAGAPGVRPDVVGPFDVPRDTPEHPALAGGSDFNLKFLDVMIITDSAGATELLPGTAEAELHSVGGVLHTTPPTGWDPDDYPTIHVIGRIECQTGVSSISLVVGAVNDPQEEEED